MMPPEPKPYADLPPVLRRLMETLAASRQGRVQGVDLSFGQDGPIIDPPAVALAGLLNLTGLGFEGTKDIAKILGGSQLAGIGAMNQRVPLTKAITPGFIEGMARQAIDRYVSTPGNGATRGYEANEAAAQGNEIATGILNELYDPANAADVAKGGAFLLENTPRAGRALGRFGRDLLRPQAAPKLLGPARSLTEILKEFANEEFHRGFPSTPGNVPESELQPGIGFAGGGGLGPVLPSTPGNVALDDLLPGIGTEGGGIGPVLPSQRGNAGKRLGPQLPPTLGPKPTPGALAELFGTPDNVPRDQLRPGVGRNGGKGLGPTLDELLQGPPVPESLVDEWLNEGVDATQGFERDYSGQLQPGEMTAFGQLLEDMGPVANPDQNRRKMALAREILRTMGLEDPLHADIDYVDSVGRKVLDKVTGPILSPEQIIAARKQIGNLGVERPLSPEQRLLNRVGALLERPVVRRAEVPTPARSLGEALQPTAPRPQLDRAGRLARRVASYSDRPFPVGDAIETTAEEIDPLARLMPNRLPDLPDPIYNRPSLEEVMRGNVPRDQLRPGVGATVNGKNPRRLGLGPTLDELLQGPHDPGPPIGPELPAGSQYDLIQEAIGKAPGRKTDLLAQVDPPLAPTRRTPDPRAMNDLLAAESVDDWSQLSHDEVMTLVEMAYQNDSAIGNAIRKYPNVGDLAQRAWDRLTSVTTDSKGDLASRGSTDRLLQLARNHPELARKVSLIGDKMGARQLNELGQADEAAKAAIEESPYFAVFKYFDRGGNFRNNPVTGARFHRPRDLETLLNTTDMDELAAEALAPFGGYNPRYSETVDDFWHTAREKFRTYKGLTGKEAVDELGFTSDGRFLGPNRASGMNFVFPGGNTRLGRIAQTAGIGGVGGYMAGDDESPEDQRNAALFGAALGAAIGGTAGSRFGQAVAKVVPALWDEGVKAQKEAWATGTRASFKDIGRIWATQNISTLRNIFGQQLTSRLWLARAGVRQEVMNDNWYSMVDLYARGQRNGVEALPQATQDWIAKTGWQGTVDQAGKATLVPNIGTTFNEANGALVKSLHPISTMIAEAGLSVASPLSSVPIAGVAMKGFAGLTRPFWSNVYSALDKFTEVSARHAVLDDTLDTMFPQAAKQFEQKHGLFNLPKTGEFAADDILAAGGTQAMADEWAQTVSAIFDQGSKRARDVFGDFTQRRWWETLFGQAVPFSSWALRAYPRTIAMMAEHPGVSLAIMAALEHNAERNKEKGRPGYQATAIDISQQIPGVKGVADALNAGKSGSLTTNLLGAFTPFQGDLFSQDDEQDDPNATPMQKLYGGAKRGIGKAGFSFNPFIVGLAYALNWDFMRPGAASRTAGVEQAMAGPEVPSFTQGPLDFLRSQQGGSVSQTEPQDRRLAQDIYDETGYAIGAPQNAAIAAGTIDPNDPRVQEADRATGQMGLLKNILSLGLPVSVGAETDTAAYARRMGDNARANPTPQVDPGLLAAISQTNPLLASILQQEQRSMTGEGALINRDADKTSRAYAALEAWDAAHASQKFFAPTAYYQARNQLRQALGIPAEH